MGCSTGYALSATKYPEGERTAARFLCRILAAYQSLLSTEACEPVLDELHLLLPKDGRARLQSTKRQFGSPSLQWVSNTKLARKAWRF